MLRFQFVSWRDVDRALIRRWNELVEATRAPPDQTAGWAQAIIEAHRVPLEEIEVFLLEDGARLRAVIPLRIRTHRRLGLHGLLIEPLNSTFSLHLDVLADISKDVCVSELFDAVKSRHGRWSIFAFNGVVADSQLAYALSGMARVRGYGVETEVGDASPFLTIDSSWDQFLLSKSANFRSNLKRKTRRFCESGRGEIRFISAVGEMTSALSAVHGIDRNSWKAEEGTAITSRPWEADFYARLVEQLGTAGNLLLTLAFVDGTPAAFDLTLIGSGKGYCLKTSFDLAFSDLSVGFVLRGELMKRLFEHGIQEYDFLGRSERYKLEWSEAVRRSQSLRILNSASSFGLALAARNRLRAAAQLFGVGKAT